MSNIKNNLVLEVEGSKDVEHTRVIMGKRHGGKNQKWKIVYLEDAATDIKKGKNEEYGMYVNRYFYIRSRLPMQRLLKGMQAR